jgi:hypothetical protein
MELTDQLLKGDTAPRSLLNFYVKISVLNALIITQGKVVYQHSRNLHLYGLLECIIWSRVCPHVSSLKPLADFDQAWYWRSAPKVVV